MPIDHPHGGGAEKFTAQEIAHMLSRNNTGVYYNIAAPLNGSTTFVTNDPALLLGCEITATYLDGEQIGLPA